VSTNSGQLQAFALPGCATYGDNLESALKAAEAKRFEKAEKQVRTVLEPSGDDALLFHLEVGLLRHLQGDYQASNGAFEVAHRLADPVLAIPDTDWLMRTLLNPRETYYVGVRFERLYINYYKALNYVLLAQEAPTATKREDWLNKARVEARRLGLKLDKLAFEKGSYQYAKNKEDDLFHQALEVARFLQGNWVDQDELTFREDGYLRYVQGLVYELNEEWDNARIAYKKAAQVYGRGYRAQYQLSKRMKQRSWLEVIRMMRRSGGYDGEWQRLARTKLTEKWRKQLENSARKESGEAVVIQHIGMIPFRKELNLALNAVPDERSLRLEPMFFGTKREKLDKLRWFFWLYADKGWSDFQAAFHDEAIPPNGARAATKTFYLGPAWEVAEEAGIIAAIGDMGIRVTVPYYSPLRKKAGPSQLRVDGDARGALAEADALHRIAAQQQLVRGSRMMNAAVARALLKNTAATQAGAAIGGGSLTAFAGKVMASGSSAAETRNWTTLPYTVRIRRARLPAGDHQITVRTRGIGQQRGTVRIPEGGIRIWKTRMLDPTQYRPFESGLGKESSS
jgi:hypothetical protein